MTSDDTLDNTMDSEAMDAEHWRPCADELLGRNREAADLVKSPMLAPPPSRRLAVVACMDARSDPLAALGLNVGEAHIIRNAGGVITDDVIRSLCVSQQALGTREIILIHHSECGLCGLDEVSFRSHLNHRVCAQPDWEIGSFADPAQDVRESIATLRASPFIEFDTHIRGFVFDVATGLLKEVDALRSCGSRALPLGLRRRPDRMP